MPRPRLAQRALSLVVLLPAEQSPEAPRQVALRRVALRRAPLPVARHPAAWAVLNQPLARPRPAAPTREGVSDQVGRLRPAGKAVEVRREVAEVVAVRAEAPAVARAPAAAQRAN